MTKYYKIVRHYAGFADTYGIDDPAHVPLNKTFSARQPTGTGYFIPSVKPVLHFCDNAFDTMLWHSCFVIANEFPPTIYEIQPIGKVIKQKCADDAELWQCGAEQIQFIRPVDTAEMFERALKEFHMNHKAKIEMYPNLQMHKIISAWVHHERSKYVY